MDSVPQDVWPLIISLMDEKTKRVMRLASTTWFNLIKYNNFTLYFTRDEELPAISERLSKYSWPISLTFEKHKLNNPNEVLRNIKNITNLVGMKAGVLNLDFRKHSITNNDWMQLSTLTNIERWEFLPELPPLELLRYFTKLKMWNRSDTPDRVHPILKRLTSIDTLIYHDTTSAWPFTFVNDPGKLTSLQFDTYHEGEHSEGQMWSYLTNLKQLVCSEYAYDKSSIDLRHVTALEKCKLKVRHLPSFESNVNLLRLDLNHPSNDLAPRNIETLSSLTRLRELKLSSRQFGASWFRPLAHLTALQELTVYSTEDQYFEESGYKLLQYLPTTLKSLSLNVDVDLTTLAHLVNLETLKMDRGQLLNDHLLSHFSNLTNLRVIVVDEQFGDRSKIATLTKLQDLDLYLFGLVAPNINFEELVNLTKLNSSQGTAWPSQVYNGLSKLTKLQWLDFRIEDDETNYDFLSGLTQLTRLRLVGAIRDESFWNNLTNLKNLQELILYRIGSVDNVFDLAQLPNLTTLQLFDAAVRFTGCDITLLTTVQSLTLTGPNEFQHDKEHLLKAMPYLYSYFSWITNSLN